MSNQNGTQTKTPDVQAADPVQHALGILIQQSTQTNNHLQQLTAEISTMNHQLFNAGGAAVSPTPPPAPSPSPGPVATITPEPQSHPSRRKEIYHSRCCEIGITKVTTMTGKWKMIFYLDGEGWSPMALGWRKGEFKSLIRMVRHVFPQISEDHFSESNYSQHNAEHQAEKNEGNYEETFIAPEPFTVEWYKKDGGNGRTYAYVERVYPIRQDQGPIQEAAV